MLYIYCHVMELVQKGFGLMIGFIGLIDTVRDCTLQFTVIHTSVHSHVFTSRHLVAASNLPLGSRTIPLPQLPGSNTNSSDSVIHQPILSTNSTQLTLLH
jgi:hypothetical protein